MILCIASSTCSITTYTSLRKCFVSLFRIRSVDDIVTILGCVSINCAQLSSSHRACCSLFRAVPRRVVAHLSGCCRDTAKRLSYLARNGTPCSRLVPYLFGRVLRVTSQSWLDASDESRHTRHAGTYDTRVHLNERPDRESFEVDFRHIRATHHHVLVDDDTHMLDSVCPQIL